MAYASVLHSPVPQQAPAAVGAGRVAWISWISIALALGLARGYAAPLQPFPTFATPGCDAAGGAAARGCNGANRGFAEQPVGAGSRSLAVATAPLPAMQVPVSLAPGPQAAATEPAQVPQRPPLPRVTSAPPARATAVASAPLALEAGTGKVIVLNGAAANVFVADPKVAEVRPASATSLFVFGIAAGRTTIAALDTEGRTLVQYDLTVEPQTYSAKQAQAMISRLIPKARIQVLAQARGLLLTGSVNTPQDAAQAVIDRQGLRRRSLRSTMS